MADKTTPDSKKLFKCKTGLDLGTLTPEQCKIVEARYCASHEK